jgi:protein involved in polysaccharide export with SLBB domain
MNKFTLLFAFVLASCIASAQSLDPASLKLLLSQKNIPERDFEEAMQAKGYNINNVGDKDPAQVQRVALETIDQLEAKVKTKPDSPLLESVQQGIDKDTKSTPEDAGAGTSKPPIGSDNLAAKVQSSDIYGMDVLRNNNLNVFFAGTSGNPTDAYVLGPGDKIVVNIWGVASFSGSYQIGADGYIRPERVPPIFLKGMTLGKARPMVRSRFAQFYSFITDNFDMVVSGTRDVTVNITGEIKRYGSYTMPATNTAINAIVAAGGPTDIGSVRQIKLIRQGEATRTFDLYQFLNNPAAIRDFSLQDNDYIQIPVIDKMVEIKGAVRRPMRYELLDNEQLTKLIEYAGGLESNAFTKSVNVRRIAQNEEVILTFSLDEILAKKQDFSILNGDEITISAIALPADNFITIEGEVSKPGQLAFKPGMRISDVLNTGFLKPQARQDLAFLERANYDGTVTILTVNLTRAGQVVGSSDDLLLQKRDRIIFYPQSRYVDKAEVVLSGAVRVPGIYPYDADRKMRVSQLIDQAGGLRPDAEDFAYIIRRDPANRESVNYIRLDLKKAVENPNSPENTLLTPADTVLVYSTSQFANNARVSVLGAVRNEGVFLYAPGMTLKDVLTMTGGLKISASQSRIEVNRVVIDGDNPVKTVVATLSVNDELDVAGSEGFVLAPFDVVVVRNKPDYGLQRFVTIQGEVKYPGIYALLSPNETLTSIIQRSGGTTEKAFLPGSSLTRVEGNKGIVIVDFLKATTNPLSFSNITIVEGDIISIAKRDDLVAIKGATRVGELYPDRLLNSGNAIIVAFSGKANAMRYIRRHALGVSKNADRNSIIVERPNGSLKRTINFGLFRIYPMVVPGSTVKVVKKAEEAAEKPEGQEVIPEESVPKEEIDWGKVLANSIQQAMSVLSLILIIQRLN